MQIQSKAESIVISKDKLSQKPTKLPTIHQKPSFNEIYLKGSRPLIVYLKHSRKVLQKSDVLFIHGMTSTIVKALRLAQTLRKQFPYLKYQIQSDSVPTIVKNENENDYEMKERSCIHIRLEKNFSGVKKEKV